MSSSTTSFTRPRRGDVVEVTIDSLAFGGAGVARLDGFVLFVSGAVPGDRVRAEVGKSKKAYAEARAVEVLEPGPERIEPVAPGHPGTPWQVLPYERQLEVKHEQVEDALQRIGRLEGFELEPIVAAAQQWRYRNKCEYSFGSSVDGALVCGFHAPGRWDEIVDLEDDMLASSLANDVRRSVVSWCRDAGLSAWSRNSGEGFLRNLVVREGRRSGEVQVRLVTSDRVPAGFDAVSLGDAVVCDGLLWTRMDREGETTYGGETELISGTEKLIERVGDLEFAVSPEAFFQTSTEMAEVLYSVAREYAALSGFERLYDLYCGIGTAGLSLSAQTREVWGLEIVEDAVADAIANAARNDIDHARFFAGDVRVALGELVAEAGSPDVLVVDPPRAGLSAKVLRRIIETSPKRLVYISCNPTTLAPNAAQLVEAGWSLRRVRPVDMFPQTPHIECVAVLERT